MSPRVESDRYRRSRAQLERAGRVIPLATQTFSKSHLHFPVGRAPHFLARGKGGRVWDIDGNEYVDLLAGLMPILLGYCDPDVDSAIREQLDRGITFSLATELEMQLAERLVRLIPCAEMVRFGKNGSDATTAAVRLARAKTGRDHIMVCGYHGWHDWYIGSTARNKGVPKDVSALTHTGQYGDLDAIEALFECHPNEIAAVILEPIGAAEPCAGYLQNVRELTNRYGSLLIFDEIITGFRFARGGAQELLRVTPDLACFGKAMGNGMPISAVVGRRDLMQGFEEVFFSGTFGGEALSIAAAIAVLDKIEREPVIEKIWRTGERLGEAVRERVSAHGLQQVIGISGQAPCQALVFDDHPNASKEAIKTLCVSSMLEHGVLTTGRHNIMYAHDDDDIAHVVNAYDITLDRITQEIQRPGLAERLGCELIRPVFAVREPH